MSENRRQFYLRGTIQWGLMPLAIEGRLIDEENLQYEGATQWVSR